MADEFARMPKAGVVELLQQSRQQCEDLAAQIADLTINPTLPDGCELIDARVLAELHHTIKSQGAQLAQTPNVMHYEQSILQLQGQIGTEREQAGQIIHQLRESLRNAEEQLANRPRAGIDKVALFANGSQVVIDPVGSGSGKGHILCSTDNSTGVVDVDASDGGTVLTVDLSSMIISRETDNQFLFDPPLGDPRHPVIAYLTQRPLEVGMGGVINDAPVYDADLPDDPEFRNAMVNARRVGAEQRRREAAAQPAPWAMPPDPYAALRGAQVQPPRYQQPVPSQPRGNPFQSQQPQGYQPPAQPQYTEYQPPQGQAYPPQAQPAAAPPLTPEQLAQAAQVLQMMGLMPRQ